jgi:hypothetical protein
LQEDIDVKKTLVVIALAVAALAGCAPMAQQHAGQPVAIQGTPGKAVVYLVRTWPDASYLTAPLTLDDRPIGATYAGTYMRLELAPGRHRLSGYGSDGGAITLDVQPDRIYFVQHTVIGSWRTPNPESFFSMMDEGRARAALSRSERAGA